MWDRAILHHSKERYTHIYIRKTPKPKNVGSTSTLHQSTHSHRKRTQSIPCHCTAAHATHRHNSKIKIIVLAYVHFQTHCTEQVAANAQMSTKLCPNTLQPSGPSLTILQNKALKEQVGDQGQIDKEHESTRNIRCTNVGGWDHAL